jgi:hypothetical protein
VPDVDEPFWDIHLALQIIVRAVLLVGWSGVGLGFFVGAACVCAWGAGKEDPILHSLQTNLSTNVVDGGLGKGRVYKRPIDLGGPSQ